MTNPIFTVLSLAIAEEGITRAVTMPKHNSIVTTTIVLIFFVSIIASFFKSGCLRFSFSSPSFFLFLPEYIAIPKYSKVQEVTVWPLYGKFLTHPLQQFFADLTEEDAVILEMLPLPTHPLR